jgi:hypothetical protein
MRLIFPLLSIVVPRQPVAAGLGENMATGLPGAK